MTRLLGFCFGLVFLLTLPVLVHAAGGKASPWLDFREARIRLVVPASPPAPGVVGAVEIRLAPDYKTYWRNVGDSGVPPQADFLASQGYSGLALDFPFPKAFDDGAGGKAWGYVQQVMLPIRGSLSGGPARLALKLDFAVCGTMCIPLQGELALDAGSAQPLESADLDRLAMFLRMVPAPATEPARLLSRAGTPDAPVFIVSVAHPGDPGALSAFAETDGFLETKSITADTPGRVAITLAGQPAPGKSGRFGPVRLTFGTREVPREITLNLDGGPVQP
ncbi:MAG: protein-disulfide reductase DsbD family protein [Beijerinckiaceae bacterium]|nr:protein-disulfide reductase DsbD family protein [Beijerinckiaceae bacterium]MCZ8298905.1 protein-disulfide reductase DsbD family protein [Beijerinckiaceae bacterium]